MKTIKLLFQIIAGCLLPLFLVGCATSGQKFSELKTTISEPAAGNGRIYLYRKTALGAAVQPDVKLNGEKVCDAVPHGFIYVDRPAGNYQISSSTEVKRTLSLTLEPGQKRYVRLNIAMGFFVGHVYPELVEDSVGEKEIRDCHYLAK